MDAEWITSPSARRVLQHADDPRPAWLWSQDGQVLHWHNPAATLFLAKLKKHGLKRAVLATPIKGQIARNIRLGAVERTSLARIQFLAGEKPTSATCAVTPLRWQNEQVVLLVVGVDPIAPEILAAAGEEREDAVLPDAVVETPEPLAPAVDPVYEPIDAAPEPLNVVEPSDSPQSPAESEDGALAASRLTLLIDRLASDDALFTPLTAADDAPPPVEDEAAAPIETADDAPDTVAPAEPEAAPDASEPASPEPLVEQAQDDAAEPAPSLPAPIPDPETVERVSRYNFDELSRILNDRVGEAAQASRANQDVARTGALINLGGETLVLNRLPLGILVFRDQQVLFANRAITEMVGYDSVESLRKAGLAAVFPAAGPDGGGSGPVNHLVQRDGTLVPVTARLQSISWQGRPALMLSASTTEVRTGHEAAVSAFAQAFADVRGDGFFLLTRNGVISNISPRGVEILASDRPLEGRALSQLVASSDGAALRDFLERPARFAESARPCLTMRSQGGSAEIIVFAQGQAGVITGYFGFVRPRNTTPVRQTAIAEADPSLLARISRGVRRPLNTILGFSDLLRSRATGALQNEQFQNYAQDIASAGQEIAALVDELDDYARLRDGRYLPQRASIELTTLLESCVLRIRQQASSARVIVRNAISLNLPRITADRASLAQAVLNLLASAIDQTPTGGAVVISAQRGDDGSIAVHVRDSSTNAVDLAERFVVFRDGVGRDGQMMAPVRSSVGLALTRSLLAVNAFTLTVDPAGQHGMLFTLVIPAELVEQQSPAESAE